MWPVHEQDDVAVVMNAMTQTAFRNFKRMMHFVDTKTLRQKGDTRFSPLQKIQSIIDEREIDKSNHYVCACVYSLHYVCKNVYSIHS